MNTDPHSHPAPATEGNVIRWARIYDAFVSLVSLGQEHRIRRRMIRAADLHPGDRVLDVGCGTGTLALSAAEAVGPTGEVYGVDPGSEMIERARSKAGDRVEFRVGVVEALDFPDQRFDVVLSTLVFHHLTDGLQDRGLVEIHRILRPNGRLLIVDFGGASIRSKIERKALAAGFARVTSTSFGLGFMFCVTATKGGRDAS